MKCGIDRRYGLFRAIAADYAKVRDDLAVYAPGDPEVVDKIQAWKIDHIALTGYRLGNARTLEVGDNLLADSKRWRLDYVDGRTRDVPLEPGRGLDGQRAPGGSGTAKRSRRMPPSSCRDDRSVDWPTEPGFWDQYLYGVGPLPLSADTARWQQAYFNRVVARSDDAAPVELAGDDVAGLVRGLASRRRPGSARGARPWRSAPSRATPADRGSAAVSGPSISDRRDCRS